MQLNELYSRYDKELCSFEYKLKFSFGNPAAFLEDCKIPHMKECIAILRELEVLESDKLTEKVIAEIKAYLSVL